MMECRWPGYEIQLLLAKKLYENELRSPILGNLFIRVPPDVIYLLLYIPKVVGI
jgi:hypothetical protein